jgi:hypothetical protein
MLRGGLDYATNALKQFEKYTYPFTYKQTVHQIAGCYPEKYYDIVHDYNKKCPRQLHLLRQERINTDVDLINQNVLLLKNTLELWNTGRETSDAVSPILFHYSFNCFNSFFINSFFRWNPPRTHGHGLFPVITENVEDISVGIKKRGIFPRLLDFFTIVGVPLGYADIIPKRDEDNIVFVENDSLIQGDNSMVTLPDILNFDSPEVYRNLKIQDEEKITPTFFTIQGVKPISDTINNILNSFLLTFLASCIARYRPAMWQSILPGDNRFHRDFMTKYNEAIYNYTIGEAGFGLMSQAYDMISRLSEQTFRLNNWNMMKIF